MNKLTFGFIKSGTIKYIILLLLNYLCFCTADVLNLLDGFDKNLIPYMDRNKTIYVLVFVLMVLLKCRSQKDINLLNIFFKRYETSIKVIIFFTGILIWQRCYGEGCIYLVYVVILYLYYMFIERESTKTFSYSISKDCRAPESYEERPVVGRELLTKPQIEALDKILTTLNNRKSTDSVNIALVGEWGKGKTSIIETLIYELQSGDSKYFFLKLDMGLLKETSNIVQYVNDFFYILFRQYGISSLGSFGGLAYFSSFQKLLEETDASILSKLSFVQNKNYFSDLEGERKLFTKKVGKLLKESGKKNIVLIIDEADRVGKKEEVARLLSEFSGVNGIISIMLLNESILGSIRPSMEMNKASTLGDEKQCGRKQKKYTENDLNEYGKYIHLEIPIKNIDKIEYEKSIKEQIVLANEKIKKEGIYYVSYLPHTDKRSIFDTISDYGTNRLVEEGHVIYGECNLLTELLNAELKESSESFGMFLEKKVKAHFLSCREFELFSIKDYAKYMQLSLSAFFNNLFRLDSFFDWPGQIGGTFYQLWGELMMVMEGIRIIEESPYSKRPTISTLDDIKICFTRNTFQDNTYYEETGNILHHDSNFIAFKSLLFSKEDEKYIAKLIANGNFYETKLLLKPKAEKIMNLNALGTTLLDFMTYIRTVMNNYRYFKMQIRESDLLNTSYLDYLLKDWHIDNSKMEELDNMKNRYAWNQNINISWPSLEAFFNTIMYDEFIDKNGRDFEERHLTEIRASILTTSKRKVLIITGKDGENKVYYRAISIAQNKKDSLIHEEREMLKVKVRKIYHEYRDTNVGMELIEL